MMVYCGGGGRVLPWEVCDNLGRKSSVTDFGTTPGFAVRMEKGEEGREGVMEGRRGSGKVM